MQQETAGTTGIDAAKTEAADAGKPGEAARKTLAMRIAHRNRLRAERLARLRAEPVPEPAEMAAPEASPPAPSPEMTPEASTAAPSAETPSREMAETPIPKPAEQAGAAPAGKTVGEAEDNAAALEEFLKALSQGSAAPASQAVADDPEPASVLPFQRPPEAELAAAHAGARGAGISEPRAAPVCDLQKLDGAGPGLIWALQRAGIACMAELAPLEAPDLVSRLGYLGRLVPAEAWIDQARAG